MKILQLIDTLNPGGAERMCVNITNVLHLNGIDVQVCTTHVGGFLSNNLNPVIKVHNLNKKSFFDIIAFLRFLRVLRQEKTEIIHAHSTSVFWAVAAKLFRHDIKIIWHDHLGRRTGKNRSNIFYKLISSRISAVISVNEEIKDWASVNMKVPDDRILFIENFPLLNKAQFLKNSEIFTIACVANILPVKNHETLLNAVGLLVKRDSRLPLKVILAGAFQKNEYYFKLLRKISDMELTEIVEMPGPVEDISALLAGADCGVLSSVSEGLPVALLEYGMAALPVIVTDVGHCAEVVGHGEYGKIVKPNDPEALATELLDFINNRELAKNMGQSFMKHVMQNYGPDRFMKQYLDLLNKITGNA